MEYRERKTRWKLIFFGSLSGTILVMLLCLTIGAVDISVGETFGIVVSKILKLGSYFNFPQYPASHEVIIWQVRLPRIILASAVGAALAAVGGVFQGLFKNPMADPYVLGISAGASLGAASAIAFQLQSVIGFFAVPAAAFAGALASTFTVYCLGKVRTGVSVYTLLLAGVALSAFFSAITSFIIVLHSRETHQIVFWMMGGFSGTTWLHVKTAVPVICGGILLLYCFARELNAMLFGDNTARHLGIDLNRVKKAILILAAMTTAAAVAVSGTIGFVGLIIPHMVRLMVGPDHRILLPAAAVFGAAFMVLTDTVARTILAPAEIPVGVLTAFFGGPFFIYLLRKKKSEFI